MPEIKIFVDVDDGSKDKVVICQENADKLGLANGTSVEVENPDNSKKTTGVIEISDLILDFAGQFSRNIIKKVDFAGVELIIRPPGTPSQEPTQPTPAPQPTPSQESAQPTLTPQLTPTPQTLHSPPPTEIHPDTTQELPP